MCLYDSNFYFILCTKWRPYDTGIMTTFPSPPYGRIYHNANCTPMLQNQFIYFSLLKTVFLSYNFCPNNSRIVYENFLASYYIVLPCKKLRLYHSRLATIFPPISTLSIISWNKNFAFAYYNFFRQLLRLSFNHINSTLTCSLDNIMQLNLLPIGLHYSEIV